MSYTSSLPRTLFILAIATLFAACSTGETPRPLDGQTPDTAPQPDTGPPDVLSPDVLSPDVLSPDTLPPDTLAPDVLSADMGPCGNGTLDPGEECDKAINPGDAGACPTACDDQNTCTTDNLLGTAADCSAKCDNVAITPCCGNGTKEGSEVCDDGNQVDVDGCNNNCKLPGGHLLITELATSPSEAEFIEIYNPSASVVPLKTVYLADRVDYFLITSPTAQLGGGPTDFVVRFPDGAVLGAGEYAVIATKSQLYKIVYGKAPDYEILSTDSAVPDMVAATAKSLGSQAGLTDAGELLVLFTWDGKTDLIGDLDYVVWKGSSASAFAKNPAICIDGPDVDTTATCYKNDTSVTTQSALKVPKQGGSLHRCNYLETGETKTAGNGATGHDETSEPFVGTGATWKRNPKTLAFRTPGKPAPPTFCPK